LHSPEGFPIVSAVKIVIVGLGEVGTHLAKVLSQEHHSVTVVDSDRDRIRRVSDQLDVTAVHGDGSQPAILDMADAPMADLLLAVSNNDNVNMLTCLFGKRMGARKTVLRLKDVGAFRKARTFFRKNLQYDLMLCLDEIAAEEVVKTIRQNQAVGVESFAEGKIQLRRLRLAEESKLIGVPVKDLKIPSGVLITAIDRDRHVIIPGGGDILQAGDDIFVLGEPKSIASVEKKTGVRANYLRKVAMYGSTGLVVRIADALKRLHVDVRVLVSDRASAMKLSDELEGVTVLHADVTDAAVLEEEHIGEVDAFLGLSDQDERNLISCQLTRNMGAKRTVALVNKPDYVNLYEQLGVDVAISPRLLCANRILSFVRSGSVSTIAIIEEGEAEVMELEVGPSSKLVGKTLAEARFPRGCVVGAIVRESGEIVIPRGEDKLMSQDNLVLFVLNQVIDKVVELAR